MTEPNADEELRDYARRLLGKPREPQPDETEAQAFARDLFHNAD